MSVSTGGCQSYFICTTPRSGSTLLCKLLSATGKSGHPDSWFHAPSVAVWLNDYLGAAPEDFATKQEMLAAIFGAARKQGTNNTGMFGLRLQRERAGYLMQPLADLHPEIPSDSGRIEAVFGKTLFIWLSRDNKLEQAISYVRATQSGLWHRAADGTELERLSPPQSAVYDSQQITQRLAKATEENLEWQHWFHEQGIEPLRLSYEKLSESPHRVLTRIFDALGLVLEMGYQAEPAVAKLADETNRLWKARYLSEYEGCHTEGMKIFDSYNKT